VTDRVGKGKEKGEGEREGEGEGEGGREREVGRKALQVTIHIRHTYKTHI